MGPMPEEIVAFSTRQDALREPILRIAESLMYLFNVAFKSPIGGFEMLLLSCALRLVLG